MNRHVRLLVAFLLLLTVVVGVGFYRANYTCGGLRDRVVQAKQERGVNGGTAAERQAVDEAADRARDRGCDVEDLVGQ